MGDEVGLRKFFPGTFLHYSQYQRKEKCYWCPKCHARGEKSTRDAERECQAETAKQKRLASAATLKLGAKCFMDDLSRTSEACHPLLEPRLRLGLRFLVTRRLRSGSGLVSALFGTVFLGIDKHH
jgi:hypothetical protein